jgi:thioredoxin 2
MDTILLRCQSCGSVNRVPKDKVSFHPRCGKCKVVLRYPGRPIAVISGTFQDEVISHPGVVLVEFWSPSCGHCRALHPVLEQIAEENAGVLKIVTVNTGEEPALSTRFNIRGVPTFILYKGGKKIQEMVGAMPKQQIEAWIRSFTEA